MYEHLNTQSQILKKCEKCIELPKLLYSYLLLKLSSIGRMNYFSNLNKFAKTTYLPIVYFLSLKLPLSNEYNTVITFIKLYFCY